MGSIKGLEYCDEDANSIPFLQSNLDMKEQLPALLHEWSVETKRIAETSIMKVEIIQISIELGTVDALD